jgi:magnesium transporter
MRRTYDIRDHQVVECDLPDAPVHLYIAPDETERRYLIDTLKVDEHTLASAMDPDELSRLEFEPDHVALIYKRPRNYSGPNQLLFRVDSNGIFLFKDKLIVMLSEDIPLFDKRLFRRVNGLQDMALRLVYRSILHFLEHLKVINMIVDEVEAKINEAMENRYLINLFEMEKSMVYYLNAIHANGVLIDKLRNNVTKLGLGQEETEFLEDMSIDNSQCYKQADIYSNILAGLMDARVSIVSNNLNVLMKRLTIITIGIMVPTFVVSAFSMNVKMPFDNNHWGAFWGIITIAGLSVLAFWLTTRRHRW